MSLLFAKMIVYRSTCKLDIQLLAKSEEMHMILREGFLLSLY